MREALIDILKHTSAWFDYLLIRGSDKETKIVSLDETKTLILEVVTKTPIPEFDVGESALKNLGVLRGLLDFPSYTTDGSSVAVKRTKNRRDGGEIVEEIEFRDTKGAGAVYRLTDPRMIRKEDRPPEVDAKWDLTFEPNRSNFDEFFKLAALYREISNEFYPMTVQNDLRFFVGDESSSNHRGSVVVQENVDKQIKTKVRYPVETVQSIVKLSSAYPTQLNLTALGLFEVKFETVHAHYRFTFRGGE